MKENECFLLIPRWKAMDVLKLGRFCCRCHDNWACCHLDCHRFVDRAFGESSILSSEKNATIGGPMFSRATFPLCIKTGTFDVVLTSTKKRNGCQFSYSFLFFQYDCIRFICTNLTERTEWWRVVCASCKTVGLGLWAFFYAQNMRKVFFRDATTASWHTLPGRTVFLPFTHVAVSNQGRILPGRRQTHHTHFSNYLGWFPYDPTTLTPPLPPSWIHICVSVCLCVCTCSSPSSFPQVIFPLGVRSA